MFAEYLVVGCIIAIIALQISLVFIGILQYRLLRRLSKELKLILVAQRVVKYIYQKTSQ